MSASATQAANVNNSTELQDSDVPEYRELPHNLDAEQALLGSLLINNEAMHQIGDFLLADHFFEPVHRRIYDAIRIFVDKGQLANPVTLKHFFDKDAALEDIGGAQYLARLAAAAGTIIDIKHYAQVLYELALKRELIGLGEDMVNTAFDPDIDQSASNQIERAEQHLFNLATEGSADRGFRAIAESVTDALHQTERAWKRDGKIDGITSGFVDMDRLLGGLHNSDLMILAGRPSMGKTALATTIACNAAEATLAEYNALPPEEQAHNKPGGVGFFSLEMSDEQLAGRLLSGMTGINAHNLRRGQLQNEEFETLVEQSKRLSQLPLFIDDTPALSISALRTRARRLKRMHNLAFLVVDYLQLLRGSVNHGENRVQEVSEVTQGLKAIAKELNIPVMALSQLSRAVEQREDKRPQLSDLRESGSIEQDADMVMFVYREEYYLARKQPREGTDEHLQWQAKMEEVHGIAEVIIAKQRHGPIGTVPLSFTADTTRFGNLEREYGGHLEEA